MAKLLLTPAAKVLRRLALKNGVGDPFECRRNVTLAYPGACWRGRRGCSIPLVRVRHGWRWWGPRDRDNLGVAGEEWGSLQDRVGTLSGRAVREALMVAYKNFDLGLVA